MNTKMLVKARQLFSVDYIPPEINRANQRKWIQSIRQLGDKWLYAENIPLEILAQNTKLQRKNDAIR
jgi:hypothetical protein